MPRPACPRCSYTRFWNVRRGRKKCRKCRAEWSARLIRISGIKISETKLRSAIRAFLLFRTATRVASMADIGTGRAKRLAHLFRLAMKRERLPVFSGIVELDETYIGGQRKNQRLHIRKLYPPKRGHGTQKLPIFGIFHRASGTVFIDVEPRKLDWRYVLEVVSRRVAPGSRIHTDGFPMYTPLSGMGYVHERVDHNDGEYVRGDVHTNGIEGFWGVMKRKMGCIGGMRRNRLFLFANEIAWRFNHRKETDGTRERALLELVLRKKVGG